MWEKLGVVWQIPELRSKILLTLLMLAIYRVGFQIQLPILDPAKVKSLQPAKTAALATCSKRSPCSAPASSTMSRSSAWASCRTSRRRSSSSCLASVYPPLEQLQKEGEAGRKKINEYTRYATFVLCLFQSWFYIESYVEPQGLVAAAFPERGGRHRLALENRRRADDDRRHGVSDVARRADRRVRHRQRHQPVDHGRHPGAHAGRRLSSCCSKRRSS